MTLSEEQRQHYIEHGYCSPIEVMSEHEAHAIAQKLEHAEARYPEHFHAEQRNNAHIAFSFLADLALDERIVECVVPLVGEHISLWSTVLFIKEPDSAQFVSWHQDATYMALAPDNFVTAWIALTPSTTRSGCVAVIPGSHRNGAAPHDDTFAENNLLTRGQHIRAINDDAAVDLVLAPGQMSLHHPWLIHGSRPNQSSTRRIGIAMQSYLGDNVRPQRGEHHVMHVRGDKPAGCFIEVERPRDDASAGACAAREAANAAFADVLYDNAAQRRKL